MPYIIELNKKTGKLENKGVGCEELPDILEYMNGGFEHDFIFMLPIGYKPHQIYWNKREPKFDEYFIILKKESTIDPQKIYFYSGKHLRLKRRDVLEFDESQLDELTNKNWEGHAAKLAYLGDRIKKYTIETRQIGRFKGEFPNRISLICGKKEIPLEELLVRGKSSL